MKTTTRTDTRPRTTARPAGQRSTAKPSTTRSTDRWVDMDEVLTYLGVATSTWRRWRTDGKAPQGRRLPNGDLRWRFSEIEQWMDGLAAA